MESPITNHQSLPLSPITNHQLPVTTFGTNHQLPITVFDTSHEPRTTNHDMIDPGTERAVRAFIVRVAGQYDLAGAVLFGSRARGNFHPGSDADIAVLLHGVPGRRVDAALKMADIAFDVMLETKTHRGLIAAFGEHLVKTARLSANLGKSLNQVERIRLLADYTGEEVAADKARWAVEQAGAFVGTVQRTLAPRKPTSGVAPPE